MKTLPSLFVIVTALTATAAPTALPDPASAQRHHVTMRSFDLKADSYISFSDADRLLDGDVATGVKYEAGRHHLILSLSQIENIESISLLGSGRARFTVFVGNAYATPGTNWQAVLKNASLNAAWGSERTINHRARHVLIEAESAAPFVISEIALYGKLTPIASGHRYLSDVWAAKPAGELASIQTGPTPKSAYRPGGLGFPPRIPGVMGRMRIAPIPPAGRLGSAPTPLRAR